MMDINEIIQNINLPTCDLDNKEIIENQDEE